jgi:hypothetical protein
METELEAPVTRMGLEPLSSVSTLACGAGFAVTALPSLNLVVTSNVDAGTLTTFRAEPGAAFTPLHTFGSKGLGPLEFDRPSFMCGWRRPGGPLGGPPRVTLLVAEWGNHRVQEVDPSAPAHIAFWFDGQVVYVCVCACVRVCACACAGVGVGARVYACDAHVCVHTWAHTCAHVLAHVCA